MRKIASILGLAVAMTVATAAMAQGSTKMHCQMIGNNAPEQLGQDHSILASNFSCRIEGGPLDKGIATGSQVYEFKGPSGTGRAGHGVVRAADGMAVYVNEEMKYDLQMSNGKVTGATGSGRGSYTMAAGSAKELTGMPYTYTWSATGPNEFTLEVK